MNLQQRRAGDRADRKHALRMIEAEATPLPTRDQEHADFPGR